MKPKYRYSGMILVCYMLYLFYQDLDDPGHLNIFFSLNSHSISSIIHAFFFQRGVCMFFLYCCHKPLDQ